MKYQAPAGVTAICCAGETFAPDESGAFDAAEGLAVELAAHGCVICPQIPTAPMDKAVEPPSRAGRGRSEKAN